MTRAELSERAVEMRAAGALMREIAAELEISTQYASDLIHDPDGAKAAARKRSYQRPCPDCGRMMTGSDGRGPNAPRRCVECQRRYDHDQRVWTPEVIIEAIRWAYSQLNRPLRTEDFHTQHVDGLPTWSALRREGFFPYTACDAAGVPFYSGFRGFGARGADTSHGTQYRYNKGGCRCRRCRAANAAYARRRYAGLDGAA
jgi:hypothetical protein